MGKSSNRSSVDSVACSRNIMSTCDLLRESSEPGRTIFYTSLSRFLNWLEENGLSGYDPYDALNSKRIKWLLTSSFTRLCHTQFFKMWPFNWRNPLGVEKGYNPKGMGLFLKSYIKLYYLTKEDGYIRKATEIKEWLKDNSSKGYSGYCWGYNFPWQTSNMILKANEPTIVNSSFIADAILDMYELTQDEECLEIANNSCRFILKDLNITEKPEVICFSYTPFDKDLCHNANLLGASLLARVYSFTGQEELLWYAKRAFDFTIYHQNPDGSWNYSIHPLTGKERRQIDFHQGFILDCIFDFIKHVQPSDKKYMDALLKGAKFYKTEQFFPDGRAKWRYPRVWPIDIHNQAQGMITFSKLGEINPEYLDFARVIAKWTIEHMQDESGFFYYQKWPLFINKIPYIRWGQAWMMLALATLLLEGSTKKNR
jgi:hypothetical protein